LQQIEADCGVVLATILAEAEVFHSLYIDSIFLQGQLVHLLQMNEARAIEMLVKHRDDIPLDAVVGELQTYPKYDERRLHACWLFAPVSLVQLE
jgi:hypothetical protein